MCTAYPRRKWITRHQSPVLLYFRSFSSLWALGVLCDKAHVTPFGRWFDKNTQHCFILVRRALVVQQRFFLCSFSLHNYFSMHFWQNTFVKSGDRCDRTVFGTTSMVQFYQTNLKNFTYVRQGFWHPKWKELYHYTNPLENQGKASCEAWFSVPGHFWNAKEKLYPQGL